MATVRDEKSAGGGRSLRRGYALTAAVYVLATLLTDAYFMADTADYVQSILAREAGRDYHFWEFGHLLWRPVGWLSFWVARPLAVAFTGSDPVAGATWVLMALNWLAGLACVLLVRAVAGRVAGRASWAANVAAVGFVFAQGFLNNAQIGSSYVPGLAFLLLGLYFLTKTGTYDDAGNDADDTRKTGDARGADNNHEVASESADSSGWRAGVAAGVALALSVCFWFPYIWALPAAFVAPVLLSGMWRGRNSWRVVAWAVAACAAAGTLCYAAAIVALGIDSPAGLKAWVVASSHGNTTRGAARAVFGLARSFVNTGNDGVLFKRYLIGDELNPVSLWALARLSLVKFALFYLFAAALAASLLWARRGRRVAALLAAGSLPIICFAVLFDGGAVERYLPLYPFVFVALAAGLASATAPRASRWAMLGFVGALVVVNGAALSKPALGRRQDETARRVADLRPRLGPRSLLYAVTWLDELVNFDRSFPFHPLNRGARPRVFSLVTPGSAQVKTWREEFAARTLAAWDEGGEVWVSRRAFAARPDFDWNWAEGDDPNVRWRDFPEFFSRLDAGETVGGDDGFFLLPPTPRNVPLLRDLARAAPPLASPEEGAPLP